MTTAAPIKEVEVEVETPKVIDQSVVLRRMVVEQHKKAGRIDVKSLWTGTWRVNVFETDNGPVVRKLTLSYSYFVKLDKDGTFFFNPSLGTKS